jgi:D-3-phosphoglycerate dehydrogenase
MKILFTAEYDSKYLETLEEFGEVNIQGWAKGISKLSQDELKDLAKDVDMIITSYDDITKEVIDAAENLKLIACTRSTPVNIDVEYAQSKGITVINTPGRNSDSAAEHTIALMFSLARHIPQAHMTLKNGGMTNDVDVKNEAQEGLRKDVVWGFDDESPYVVFKGMELKDKTLGIVGFGSIGRRVAKMAAGIGMNIVVYDPYVANIEIDRVGQKKVDFDTLLQESDFITVHLAVTEETKNTFNKDAFSKMKETAYFVNTARAAVVNETDLIEALRAGEIAGAGLDVFENEPIYKGHPFITELDNVVITPHIGGATYDAIENHTLMIVQELERYFNDEPLLYEYKLRK